MWLGTVVSLHILRQLCMCWLWKKQNRPLSIFLHHSYRERWAEHDNLYDLGQLHSSTCSANCTCASIIQHLWFISSLWDVHSVLVFRSDRRKAWQRSIHWFVRWGPPVSFRQPQPVYSIHLRFDSNTACMHHTFYTRLYTREHVCILMDTHTHTLSLSLSIHLVQQRSTRKECTTSESEQANKGWFERREHVSHICFKGRESIRRQVNTLA